MTHPSPWRASTESFSKFSLSQTPKKRNQKKVLFFEFFDRFFFESIVVGLFCFLFEKWQKIRGSVEDVEGCLRSKTWQSLMRKSAETV